MGFPGGSDGKESPAMWETWVDIQYFVSFRYTAKKDYTHIFFFRFFSIVGYYKLLNIVTCAL